MKQLIYFFSVSVLLVSCNARTGDAETSQDRIDSIVNAKVEALRTEMKMRNDSLINVMARAKADSILKGMKK